MNLTRSDFFPLTLSLLVVLMTTTAFAGDKPVKVYLLSGQSNMVGIGQVTGGGSRWGSEFIDPVLSVYSGKYDPNADYEKLTPTKTLKLEKFGGVKPTPYRGGSVAKEPRHSLQPERGNLHAGWRVFGQGNAPIVEGRQVDGNSCVRLNPQVCPQC